MSRPSRILIHLDHNPHPRVFDQIMSLDGGAERILAHGDVDPSDVPVLVSGALYARPLEELRHTALLVTGTNDHVVSEMVRQARRVFFDDYRISILSECRGGNAVAAATVARLAQMDPLEGARTVVLGGGPVGARIAGLLTMSGASVALSAFDEDQAVERQAFIHDTFACDVTTVVWKTGESLEALLEPAEILITAGPPSLTLVPRSAWEAAPDLRFIVDISGTDPPGIEGVNGEHDGTPFSAKGDTGPRVVGGLAVCRHKIRVHRAAVRRLFEDPGVVLGPREVADLAREAIAG